MALLALGISACSEASPARPSAGGSIDQARQWLLERLTPTLHFVPFGDGAWPTYGESAALKALVFDGGSDYEREIAGLIQGQDPLSVTDPSDQALRALILRRRGRPLTDSEAPKSFAWPPPTTSLGRAAQMILSVESMLTGDSLVRRAADLARAFDDFFNTGTFVGVDLLMAAHAYQRVEHAVNLDANLGERVFARLARLQRYDGSWRIEGEDRAWTTLCVFSTLRVFAPRD